MHESVKLKDVEYDAMKPIYQNLSAMVVPCCTVKKSKDDRSYFKRRLRYKKLNFLNHSVYFSNLFLLHCSVLAY